MAPFSSGIASAFPTEITRTPVITYATSSLPPRTMATDTLERPNIAAEKTTKRPKNRGNFANNPTRAREAGRKGGKARGKPKSNQS